MSTHGQMPPTTTPKVGRKVRLRILRQDGPEKPSRWETFEVPVTAGANVISCLQWIAANPRTIEGKTTAPVAWDANCLEEVCGACTMLINGKVRQSCSCLIDAYAPNDGDEITLEPLTKFPVVRDLFVDRSRLFRDLKRIKAWVPIDGTWDRGPGPRETPDKQAARYRLSECMSCACCLEACPQYLKEEAAPAHGDSRTPLAPSRYGFVGAAVIGQTRLFNEHSVGATLKGERLDVMMGPGGINDCGQAQNCVKVCPKYIPLTEAIAVIGRQTTVHALKKFFVGTPGEGVKHGA